MLFSRDNKSDNNTPKKRSLFGQLFNPNVGTEIAPVFESGRMFVRMLAYILAAYKLFPKNHPALENTALKLSLGDVMRTAYSRLSFTREGIPQIILFVAVFGCLLFSALFIVTLLFSLMMGSAHAQTTTTSVFQSPFESAGSDWALNWINFLFLGQDIPKGSGVYSEQPAGCDFQEALAGALSIYSSAILVLAGFLLMYHLVFMIAEQAHSGKIMGKANQIWAPIRLVFAIGMLVPITAGSSSSAGDCSVTGYNTAQYAASQIARWGSGLGSTIWEHFVVALADKQYPVCPDGTTTTIDGDDGTVSRPSCIRNPTDVALLVKTLLAMDACAYFFNEYIEPYNNLKIQDSEGVIVTTDGKTGSALKYFKIPRVSSLGLDMSKGQGAFLGIHRASGSTMNQPVAQYMDFMLQNGGQFCGGYVPPPYISSLYDGVRSTQYDAIKSIYGSIVKYTDDYAKYFILNKTSSTIPPDVMDVDYRAIVKTLREKIDKDVSTKLKEADKASNDLVAKSLGDPRFTQGGWLTAGSWFTTVSKIQAGRSDAVRKALPRFVRPSVFGMSDEHWATGNTELALASSHAKAKLSAASVPGSVATSLEKYMENMKLATSYPYGPASINDSTMTKEEANIYEDEEASLRLMTNSSSDSLVDDLLSRLDSALSKFNIWNASGVIGLNFGYSSDPLSEIANFGQNNVAAAIHFMAIAGGISIISVLSPGLSIIVSLFVTISMLLFTAGFTLGYIVPLYPFYRFFFGSLVWAMTVFEAIILAPLFALAHIEPQGEGLAGKRGAYGYHVMMQLLLRPALMVFGLIAGYLLFRIGVAFLNDAFIFATRGTGAYAGGFPTLAKIIYTIIYCALVVILANQCFSTIGLFPQVALKWLGLGGIHEERNDTGMVTAAAGAASAHISGKMADAAVGPGKALQAKSDRMVTAQNIKDQKAAAAADSEWKSNMLDAARAGNAQNLGGATDAPTLPDFSAGLGGAAGAAGAGSTPTSPPPPSGGSPSTGGNIQNQFVTTESDDEEARFDREVERRGRMPDDEEYRFDREVKRREELADNTVPPETNYDAKAGMKANRWGEMPSLGPAPNEGASTTPKSSKLDKVQDEWLAKTDGGKKAPDNWNDES